MRQGLAVREITLGGIALLAAVAALAVSARVRHHATNGPHPVGSYVALAGSSGPAAFVRRTARGGAITENTKGIAPPPLP